MDDKKTESCKELGKRFQGEGRTRAKCLRQNQACLVQGTKSRSRWLGQLMGGRER